MTQPAKFTFANEFSTSEHADKLKELQAELANLEAQLPQAEARGFSAGQNDASGRLAEAMARLSQAVTLVLNTFEEERLSLKRDAVELAILTARTIAGHVLDEEPVEAIHALAASCIDNLRKCPHIVFRVHPDIVEGVEASLKKLAHESGLEGRLIVMGDPEKPKGDCKIEWAEGGFEHRRQEIEARIEETVKSYMVEKLGSNPGTTEDNNG